MNIRVFPNEMAVEQELHPATGKGSRGLTTQRTNLQTPEDMTLSVELSQKCLISICHDLSNILINMEHQSFAEHDW